MLLTLKRGVLPPKQGVEGENRVRYALDRKKKILTICTLVHPTLKRHHKTLNGGRSQFHLGVFLSNTLRRRLSLAQGAAEMYSD